MSRQRRPLARAIVSLALALSFAASTATYKQQAKVDAKLSNGTDVTVTQSPGVSPGPGAGAAWPACDMSNPSSTDSPMSAWTRRTCMARAALKRVAVQSSPALRGLASARLAVVTHSAMSGRSTGPSLPGSGVGINT